MNIILLIMIIWECILFSMLQYVTILQKQKFMVFVIFTSIIMIINNNWEYLPDIPHYLNNFEYINLNSDLYNVNPNYYGFEMGFMTLSLILKKVWNNQGFYLCSIFLINYYCIYKSGQFLSHDDKTTFQNDIATNYEDRNLIVTYDSTLFMSLWMGYFGVLYGMAVLRAGLSISFAFYGLILLYKKNHIKSIIMLLIAFSMQSFIVVLILVAIISYLLINIKNKRSYYIWLTVCICLWLSRISLLLLSHISSLSLWASSYIKRFTKISLFYNEVAGNGFFSKKNFLYLILTFLFIYFKPDNDIVNEKLLNIFMVGLTITYLTNEMVVGYRLSDMFFVFSIPLSYNLIKRNAKIDFKSRCMLIPLFIVAPFIISFRMI